MSAAERLIRRDKRHLLFPTHQFGDFVLAPLGPEPKLASPTDSVTLLRQTVKVRPGLLAAKSQGWGFSRHTPVNDSFASGNGMPGPGPLFKQ